MHPAIRAAGADVAALSVDSPERSQAVRDQLGLPFPILGDSARRVVREWDLYNPKEQGGIAIPAVFVIGTDRRVRYRSVDRTAARVSTDGVLGFLRGDAVSAPGRTRVRAGLRDFARAIGNMIRRGLRTPEE
jgi:peroxiredoxin